MWLSGLQERYAAALRLPPLDSGPSTFGLSRGELEAEISRCSAEGWQLWELEARFVIPERRTTETARGGLVSDHG